MSRIAIVGMACRYPDAASPGELWENALAGRRAFRRLPDVRMRTADYWDADPAAPDRCYARTAAVIEGYEFDRVGYRIAGSQYRSTDLTHWLALDTAARALADAGFPMAEGLPHERTAAIVGNTLTGEFSRANVMRLRWPYVRRTVAAALRDQGWEDDELAAFLAGLEERYKSPFPAIDEDTLAGGLANTIAGRLCNYFDLNGGGYTVDGACSSSLLSVVTAGRMLDDGDADIVIAGGVDLSIDPFEIIGFAKTGALARGEMRVYDRGSNGFWPGEGCGMVVLMREEDARESGRRVYATVAGWGISSDGKGGITRPEVGGYRLALRRAYERAGFGIETVRLFEGHGTGTAVGDATELTALSQARAGAPVAAIGSVKGMIGHTKAAAGVAGLIKAAMAVHHEVLPPTIGCVDPHDVLTQEDATLRVLRTAERWPAGDPVRAGVTAMGFGGINTHVVLEKTGRRRRRALDRATKALATSAQDVELLLIDGGSWQELRERLTGLADFVPRLSYAQLADLADTLRRDLRDLPYRAATVVSSPEDAERRLRELLEAGESTWFGTSGFIGHASDGARIGYLFPGQGSGRGTSGGALRRRLAEVDEVYVKAALPTSGDMVATAVAQPRIVTGSLAGLRALSLLGLEADVAVGHSLGEISALHWAGALDEDTALRVAGNRGRIMTEHSSSGTMASVSAAPEAVTELIGDLPVVIAGYNGPRQTIVAGTVDAIEAVEREAGARGLGCARLRVSHAFHSPLVAPAAGAFAEALTDEEFGRVEGRVVSTVTGEELTPGTDIRALLHEQIIAPVLFAQATERAAEGLDLLIEVGPGRVLSGLAAEATDVPAIALDTDSESLRGLLSAAGAAYVAGAPVDLAPLFHGRLVRALEIGAEFSFFANPCEQAPSVPIAELDRPAPAESPSSPEHATSAESSLELLRRLAAERAELPLEMVGDDSRLLDDLHLSSITVGQVINEAVKRMGVAATSAPTNFATSTVSELATALDELVGTEDTVAAAVEGAAEWARAFTVDLDELPLPTRSAAEASGRWQVFGDHPFAEPLRRGLERANVGPGVLVCLPDDCAEGDLEAALRGAQTALGSGARFVLVQAGAGRGAAGLAKTLRLEAPDLRVTIVHVPTGPTGRVVEWVVTEVAATATYAEAYYDADGVRRVPTLRAMPVRSARTEQPLSADDVLLVTGGGKGITAECALVMATDSGAKLALLGRSDPAADDELAANLRRMADAGVTAVYARADVGDAAQVRAAIAEVTAALGPVTAVLHGAGRNEPRALAKLDMDELRRTFAPKIDGLRNVLDAVDADRLRLLVTFGSIIGRAGLPGEAHYATANEWLADLTRAMAPRCRSICMEWSVWSGVGMGERLNVVESLSREGVTPIAPDQGVRILRRLLADPDAPDVVVISGRTEGIDTVRRELPELPLLRFVDRPLIRYHGVELVAEVELDTGTDRYLDDHRLDGNLLFPAVFGMEAMAQAAAATTGRAEVPVIEDAEFLRPIVVPPDGSTTIRIAAAVTDDDTVAVAIRSAETDFAAEHFRATLRYGLGAPADGPPEPAAGLPPVPLDPLLDMYGDVLFQGERFQRLRRYRRAAALDVDADVAAVEAADWFAGFLPAELLLGDPGMRDALMHGNQVCVPDATLLPSGVERVHPGGARLAEAKELRYCATERLRDGDTYVYDIAVRTASGEVVERWDGLRLRAVRKKDGRGPWVIPLLGPYLERTLPELVGDVPVAVAVEPHEHDRDRDDARARAESRVGGGALSDGPGLTLCVAAEGTVACDVEPVAEQDLPGACAALAERLAAQTGEAAGGAATRVRAAMNCLREAGLPEDAPLDVAAVRGPWAVLTHGDLRIATLVTALRNVPDTVAFAVLVSGRP